MQFYIKEIRAATDAKKDGPFPVAPEILATEMARVVHAPRILRLEKDSSNWLEVGWLDRGKRSGFVFRENYEGKFYHSDEAIGSTDEATKQVVQYLTTSIADIDEWFTASGSTQDDFSFITGRFNFEFFHKRFRLKSVWSKTIVVAIWLPFLLAAMVLGAAFLPFGMWIGAGLMGLLLLAKFDFRGPKKKSSHSYHTSG